jgi:hypothetical protein
MRAREALLTSDVIPGDLKRLFPICTPDASDEVVELLNLGGRPLLDAMLMMIPEAWKNNNQMDPARQEFYAFHSSLMEPRDGPAAVVFTDGTVVGGVLDRNGLRPGRFWVTGDGLVVLASEAGVLDIPQDKIIQKGRLQPGRMFLVDLGQHRIISDEEIKPSSRRRLPTVSGWLGQNPAVRPAGQGACCPHPCLGRYANKSSPLRRTPDQKRKHKQAGRRERYRLRYKLRKITRLKRVRACGHTPIANPNAGPGLRLSVLNGQRVAGMTGLAHCGSVWACPALFGQDCDPPRGGAGRCHAPRARAGLLGVDGHTDDASSRGPDAQAMLGCPEQCVGASHFGQTVGE